MIYRYTISAGCRHETRLQTHLAQIALRQLALKQDHRQCSEESDKTVTDVAEHDCEQEGERNDSKQARVDLLVRRYTVGVHDGLETFSKLVRAVERRWGAIRAQPVQDGRDVGAGLLLRNVKRQTCKF